MGSKLLCWLTKHPGHFPFWNSAKGEGETGDEFWRMKIVLILLLTLLRLVAWELICYGAICWRLMGLLCAVIWNGHALPMWSAGDTLFSSCASNMVLRLAPFLEPWFLLSLESALLSGSLRQADGVICRYLHSIYLSDVPGLIEACTEASETSLKGSGYSHGMWQMWEKRQLHTLNPGD